MHFHAWIFLPFFLFTYAVYLVVKKTRFRNLWIVIVSYLFYGWWNPLYPVLMAYSTVVDYAVLACMEKSRHKRLWPAVSIGNSLFILGFFKYGTFISENINTLLSGVGSSYLLPSPGWLLPLGLSFYVLKSIGYVLDCYRGQAPREKNLIRHAAFVGFFPLLPAGPIERAIHIFPQLKRPPRITVRHAADGFFLFTVGLVKKVALADALALYVDTVYEAPQTFQSPALLLATISFAWQIYFDFSGYTDMARGIAQMMGFEIIQNFNCPYLATGLSDFWRRWHISLSTWFRDYVYIPLGGNRKGKWKTCRNVLLTMLLSGLWHGAAWTFLVWGALHGVGLVLTRNLERSRFYKEKIPHPIKQLWVFMFVCFAWIFFRAETWDKATLIVIRIFASGLSNPQFPLLFAGLICIPWIYQLLSNSLVKRLTATVPMRIGILLFLLLYLALFGVSTGRPFIYAQF
ncbi:MAG: MBOAT family protein [Sedimentisphaerales bacterium]|nr:MBOAT family protein [Sedimentisphaerales bacterium]